MAKVIKSKKPKFKLLVIGTCVILAIIILLYFQDRQIPRSSLSIACYNSNPEIFCLGFNYHSNGTATFTLQQHTNNNWQIATVLFVSNQSSHQNVTTLTAWNSTNATKISVGLPAGMSKVIDVRISGPVSVGTVENGWLWARFQINASRPIEYAKIGSISARAT